MFELSAKLKTNQMVQKGGNRVCVVGLEQLDKLERLSPIT